jgi:hypothetical protein
MPQRAINAFASAAPAERRSDASPAAPASAARLGHALRGTALAF